MDKKDIEKIMQLKLYESIGLENVLKTVTMDYEEAKERAIEEGYEYIDFITSWTSARLEVIETLLLFKPLVRKEQDLKILIEETKKIIAELEEKLELGE